MAESKRQLLSIGIFFIIIVVGILLVAMQVIKPWSLFFPVILILSGCWILILAAIRSSKPQKYERGAFSTMGMGSLLVALGGAWYLVTSGYFWYGLALILLVLGALAIAAALRRK
jgi:hypothetical protein